MPHKRKSRTVNSLDTVADRLEELLQKFRDVPTDLSPQIFTITRETVLLDGVVNLIIDLQQSALSKRKKR